MVALCSHNEAIRRYVNSFYCKRNTATATRIKPWSSSLTKSLGFPACEKVHRPTVLTVELTGSYKNEELRNIMHFLSEVTETHL